MERLLTRSRRAHASRPRSWLRTLAAYIVSHLGELSSVTIRAVEVITIAYRSMMVMYYFEDGISLGISLERRAAEFRMRFKDAFMRANAPANASGSGRYLALPVF